MPYTAKMSCTLYYQATLFQMQPSSLAFSSATSNTDSRDALSRDQNAFQLNLISQYLVFTHQSRIQPHRQPADSQPRDQEDCPGSAEEPVGRKLSSFHNFQKHLINTLKNSVRLKRIRNIETSRLRMAYELWEYFVSSAKCTKKLLYAILGEHLPNNPQLQKTPGSQHCELHELIAQAQQPQIAAAQNYLRNVIVKQARGLLNGKLLKGRRMQRSQEFKKYFQEFVGELEGGNITRRLSKDKKKSLLSLPQPQEQQEQ